MCSVAGTHARLGAAHACRAPSSEGLERPGRWPGGRESGCLQQPCCPGSAFPDRDRRPSLLGGTSRTGLAGTAPSLKRFKASPCALPRGFPGPLSTLRSPSTLPLALSARSSLPRHRRLGKSLGSRPCPLLACWPEGPCVLLQDHSASWLPPELSLSQEPQVALQRTHPQATPLPCLPPHEAPWDQARSLTRPGPSGLLPPPPTAVCLGASARVHGLLWPHFGAVSLADHPDRLL